VYILHLPKKAALEELKKVEEKWGKKYPSIKNLEGKLE